MAKKKAVKKPAAKKKMPMRDEDMMHPMNGGMMPDSMMGGMMGEEMPMPGRPSAMQRGKGMSAKKPMRKAKKPAR